MATSRSAQDYDSNQQHFHAAGRRSRHKLIRPGDRWFIVALAVTIVAFGMVVLLLLNFRQQIADLQDFKQQQLSIADDLSASCGGLQEDLNYMPYNFDTDECKAAIDTAGRHGIVGQYCGDGLSIKKTKLPDDDLPTIDDGCYAISDRISRINANIIARQAEEQREQNARTDILNACSGIYRMTSPACNAAKARYNNDFTYVLCVKDGSSLREYVVPSKDIYDGAWHYTYYSWMNGGVDPHAGEECTW